MPSLDEPLLLDLAPAVTSIESGTEVSSSPPLRWVVPAVVALALLLWGLYAWPKQAGETDLRGDDPATAGSSLGSPSGRGESEPADPDRSTTAKSARPAPDAGETAERATAGGDQGGDGGDDGNPVGPIVGEPTGLGVVVGSYDSVDPLLLLALDSGRSFELSNLRGRPVGKTGQTLVLATWDDIHTADLTSRRPEAVSIMDFDIMEFDSGVSDYVQVVGETIWTTAGAGEDRRMVGLSIDGDLVDEVDLSGLSLGFSWLNGPVGPDIVESKGGGVYRRSGSDFQRLSTGRVRVAGEAIVLVDECDDRMRCTSRWHDRETWDSLDLPAPAYKEDTASVVVGADRWLLTTNWRTGGVELIEIETGLVAREWQGGGMLGFGQAAPISPDGRWLVDLSVRSSPVVVDLDSGAEWPVELSPGPDAVVTIIDLTGTAFAPSGRG